MAPGEFRRHLLDLHDLFRGAAEEAEQGLGQRLTQKAQTGECLDATRKMRVAAPWQPVGELREIRVGRQIARQFMCNFHGEAFRCGPPQLVTLRQLEPRGTVGPHALPAAVGRAMPPEGLPAVEHLGENRRGKLERGNRPGWRARFDPVHPGRNERTPFGPLRRVWRHVSGESRSIRSAPRGDMDHFPGISHRKLFSPARTPPPASSTRRRQAAGRAFAPGQSLPVRPSW